MGFVVRVGVGRRLFAVSGGGVEDDVRTAGFLAKGVELWAFWRFYG